MQLATGFSCIAILLSAWTLYKTHFESARLRSYFGDSLDIVKHSDGKANSIQLASTFVNLGSRTGIIDKLVLSVNQDNDRWLAPWQMFCDYEQGHNSVPMSKVHSIQVTGKTSMFQLVQFHNDKEPQWKPGICEIKLYGWYNGRECSKTPNLKEKIRITLSGEFAKGLMQKSTLPPSPELRTVMIHGREFQGI